MAHDLKTPLSVISLYAETLEDSLHKDTAKCETYTKYISDNVEYMNGLIMNILSYSNSCNMNDVNEYEKVDVREEITKYLELIAPAIKANNLSVSLIGESSQITNRKIWNQSVFNIIDNAVKYASPDSEIKIQLTHNGLVITNKVDNDISDVTRLLKPFVKGESSRSDIESNGLGLAIVDNNLKHLGYKLNISCKDKQFIVKIL